MIKKYLKTLIVLILMFVLTFSYAYVFAEEAIQENPEINTEMVEGEQQSPEGETMPITTEAENAENVQTENTEQATENVEQPVATDENSENAESTEDTENIENAENIESSDEESSNLKSSDVFLSGDEVTVDYPIDGNLYIMAKKVNIKSEIGGDAFIIANELNIEQQGYIFSNLFVVSDTINIDSVIYDMYAVAKKVNITSNGSVYRDARIIASDNVSILGNIGRNAFIGGNSNLSLTDGNSEGSINGNLNYSTSKDLPEEDFRSYVSGDINFKKVSITSGPTLLTYLKTLVNKLLLIAIIWLVYLWLAPKYLKNSGMAFTKKPIQSVLLGLLFVVAAPVLALILLMSKIASIVSLVIFAIFGLLLVLSPSLFSITLGNLISNKINKDSNIINLIMALVVGLVFYLVGLIPILGSIVYIIVVILGIGSLISYLVNSKNQEISN